MREGEGICVWVLASEREREREREREERRDDVCVCDVGMDGLWVGICLHLMTDHVCVRDERGERECVYVCVRQRERGRGKERGCVCV